MTTKERFSEYWKRFHRIGRGVLDIEEEAKWNRVKDAIKDVAQKELENEQTESTDN